MLLLIFIAISLFSAIIFLLLSNIRADEQAKTMQVVDQTNYDELVRKVETATIKQKRRVKQKFYVTIFVVAGVVITFGTVLKIHTPVIMLILVLTVSLSIFIHKRKIAKQRKKLKEQLPAVVDKILYENQLNLPIRMILQKLEWQSPEPIKSFFKDCNAKIKAGLLPYQALKQAARAHDILEIDILSGVLALQNKYGFSVHSAFNFMAKNWRNQLILQKKIRAALVENRTALVFLSLLPVVGLLFHYFRAPNDFMVFIGTTLGRVIYGIAALLYIAGLVIFHRLTDIDI